MSLIESIKSLFTHFFARDPEAILRRNELRRLHAYLAELRPPCYRPKQNAVLPGFAESILAFARLLRPLSDLVRATVANTDTRSSQRYFDFLIECRFSPLARDRRASFTYEGMSERLSNSLDARQELEIIDSEFQAYLRELEGFGFRRINEELGAVDRFIDVVRFDWERLLAIFDPGVSMEASGRRADFSPVDGEQVLPDLIDLHYVLAGFAFEPHLRANLIRLMERKAAKGLEENRRKKIEWTIVSLDKALVGLLSPDLLLSLIRAIKGDPEFLPSMPREKKDFYDSFKTRLTIQCTKERERLDHERREDAVSTEIKALFGEGEILVVENYDEEMDSYLRSESPNGLLWIKPLRILKTFIANIFVVQLMEPLKRLLVEGYFENKAFQNNLANILYQCEHVAGRIPQFEAQLQGNGRISITAIRRYVEEIKRGKDIGHFLTRLVDAINGNAEEIVVEEAGLFGMLGEGLSEIMADAKHGSPDLVTNIRSFGGGRNRELLAQLQLGRDRLATLAKIMRSFAVIKSPPSGITGGLRGKPESTDEGAAGVIEGLS